MSKSFEDLVRAAWQDGSSVPGPAGFKSRLALWDDTADFLTTRALNCLINMGYTSARQLIGYSRADLIAGLRIWPACGRKTANEIADLVEALAAERFAARSAALDALAVNDAPLIGTTTTEAATARVAMAREAAPEPVTISHWGMHA